MGSSEAATEDLFAAARGRLRTIVVLAVVGAVAGVVPFIAIVELARELLGDADAGAAWTIVAIACAALAVSAAAGLGTGIVGHFADADLAFDLRKRIVHKLRQLPLGWFDARSSGAVKKAVENDVAAMHQLVAHAIQDSVTAVAVPLISLVYLFIVDWRMALASLVPLAVAMVLFVFMMRGSSEKYVEYDKSVEQLTAATIEYVHGIAVVQSFGQAGRSHKRYHAETRRFVNFYDLWMRETSVKMTLIEIITSPIVVLLYLSGVGLWLVDAGAAPVDVLPALLLGAGVTAPLLQLGSTSQFLRNATKARESLTSFLSQEPISLPADPVRPDGEGVALERVSFSYDGTRNVLHEIAAACAPGTVTALVGASGSGKSTLARLIPRFYDTSSGTVSIGGTDVRAIAPEHLYHQVGFVFQDAYLLRTSVRDNIRLTRPEASAEDIEAAARAAQIHERIMELARGYDSIIGEDAHLSGGEAQRLTIARALLTDAPVLVLDEATAFADPDSEAAIQTALSALAATRTLLVIAHRLHTITHADQIIVLGQGRILERGTHAELAGTDGPYRDMWQRYEAARRAADGQVIA